MGPDIAGISRRMHVHEETLRYWYKEKLAKKGITHHAIPSYRRLGLERAIVEIEFAPQYRPIATRILSEMGERSYLGAFGKLLPSGIYYVVQRLPPHQAEDYDVFLTLLQKKGVLDQVHAPYGFSWSWTPPMRPEFYNFDSYSWEASLDTNPRLSLREPTKARMSEFDLIDLKILEQLQVNASKSLKAISRKLGLNYQRTIRHYHHVVENNLIEGYSFNWLRTTVSPGSLTAPSHRHENLAMLFLVRNVNNHESRSLAQVFRRVPFLIYEGGGHDYVAQLFVPLRFVNEVLAYLQSGLPGFSERLRCLIVDQDSALGFSIPADLYDERTKRWVFEPNEAASKVERIIQEIRRSSKTG